MIFIGYSHMLCVLYAVQDAGLAFTAVALKEIETPEAVAGFEGRIIVDRAKPDFSERTKLLLSRSSGPIFSFITGIQHVQMGLRRLSDAAEPAFDFVLPEAPDLALDGQAEFIPYDAVRAALVEGFRRRLKQLERVAEMAPGRVYQFGPPPPPPESWTRRLMEKKEYRGAPMPNPVLQRKLWRAAIDVFRERAEQAGARFIDCPPAALDDNGLMRHEMVRNLTHGNALFGALVLEQIRGIQ